MKYEDVYLCAYQNGRGLNAGLTRCFDFYNRKRLHQSLDYQTPDDIYFGADAAEPTALAA